MISQDDLSSIASLLKNQTEVETRLKRDYPATVHMAKCHPCSGQSCTARFDADAFLHRIDSDSAVYKFAWNCRKCGTNSERQYEFTITPQHN